MSGTVLELPGTAGALVEADDRATYFVTAPRAGRSRVHRVVGPIDSAGSLVFVAEYAYEPGHIALAPEQEAAPTLEWCTACARAALEGLGLLTGSVERG